MFFYDFPRKPLVYLGFPMAFPYLSLRFFHGPGSDEDMGFRNAIPKHAAVVFRPLEEVKSRRLRNWTVESHELQHISK